MFICTLFIFIWSSSSLADWIFLVFIPISKPGFIQYNLHFAYFFKTDFFEFLFSFSLHNLQIFQWSFNILFLASHTFNYLFHFILCFMVIVIIVVHGIEFIYWILFIVGCCLFLVFLMSCPCGGGVLSIQLTFFSLLPQRGDEKYFDILFVLNFSLIEYFKCFNNVGSAVNLNQSFHLSCDSVRILGRVSWQVDNNKQPSLLHKTRQ